VIQFKTLIVGQVIRIVGKTMYVRDGDAIDTYNTDYYRVIEG
jgi:hypothetical protein